MKHLLALIAFSALILAACATAPATESVDPCQTYVDELKPILDRWYDAERIASSTSRISLDGPVGMLQEIRTEVRQLDVPECGQTAHSHILASLESTIEGYLAFMSQSSDSVVVGHFRNADQSRYAFHEAIVNAGFAGQFQGPCDVYVANMNPIIARWSEVYSGFNFNNRNTLAIVRDLSELRAIVQFSAVPTCAEIAHGHLLSMMDETILGMEAHGESRIQTRDAHFVAASEQAQLYQAALTGGSP